MFPIHFECSLSHTSFPRQTDHTSTYELSFSFWKNSLYNILLLEEMGNVKYILSKQLNEKKLLY